jgi:hypothetical protein
MSTARALSSGLAHLVLAFLSFCISWQHLLMNEPKNGSCSSPCSWSSQFLIWPQPSASAVQYVSCAARALILAERGGMVVVAAVAGIVVVVEEEDVVVVVEEWESVEWKSRIKEGFLEVKR